jgi:hypothetical protein
VLLILEEVDETMRTVMAMWWWDKGDSDCKLILRWLGWCAPHSGGGVGGGSDKDGVVPVVCSSF